jgi:heterodisulfide reductase subunit A-like polyferredoxin
MNAEGSDLRDVLVIGGGVSGIQAALDLADMGIHVHLVEKQPSIGGRMAQLDKTFPTNDCSICILSPKLADCSRHPNITLHTCCEVEEVTGSVGDFTVHVLERARYVDEAKCTACGDCVQVCPITLLDEFNETLSERKAIYRPYAQAIPNAYLVNKRGTSPCKDTCPADTSAQGYIALIAQGRYEEALEVVKQYNPFPATVGRVCDHKCEDQCNRGKVDGPVAICALKRFVADWVYAQADKEVTPEESPRPRRVSRLVPAHDARRVAIVGAGPAGLSAAHFLAQMGYRVTIFEALPVPGGMMRVGIPPYRLPRNVLQREIDSILELGVELKLYNPISDVNGLFDKGFDAVFLAIGAHEPQHLQIPGEDAQGVHHGVPFLRSVNLGEEIRLGKRVVVVGGGNTAIDAARSSLRLGAETVTIAYRRSRVEMPANSWEIEDAEREGVKLELLTQPVEILSEDGRITGVRCVRMRLGEPDASGRRQPIPIEGSEFTIETDALIAAVAQAPEVSFLKPDHGLEITQRGTFVVDPQTLETNRPGVFAGGDSARGPGALIQAIADGRRAALSIDRYLRGVPLLTPRELEPLPVVRLTEEEIAELAEARDVNSERRATMSTASVQERIRDFREVELGLSEEQARAEALRCLRCGICAECWRCVEACGANCIDHQMADQAYDLNVAAIVVATGFDPFDPSEAKEYGYGRYKNVITSLEYERLISASGPTGGHLRRLSDHEPVKRLGFIQCVGSRNLKHNRFCSSVCCMYATKEAILANEHDREVQSVIFYTDLRAAGKGFQEYVDRAQREYNARYVRARVAEITQDADENPLIWYEDTRSGERRSERVDLAVLATSLVPRRNVGELAERLEIELDEYNFVKTDAFSPMDTTRPGVFACGYCRGPADIPVSVAQASGAAARAAEVVMGSIQYVGARG